MHHNLRRVDPRAKRSVALGVPDFSNVPLHQHDPALPVAVPLHRGAERRNRSSGLEVAELDQSLLRLHLPGCDERLLLFVIQRRGVALPAANQAAIGAALQAGIVLVHARALHQAGVPFVLRRMHQVREVRLDTRSRSRLGRKILIVVAAASDTERAAFQTQLRIEIQLQNRLKSLRVVIE